VTSRFQKPTRAELTAYAQEIGYVQFAADEFIDHFETVGWVVGRNRTPMVSWRHAVHTWRRNQERWAMERDPQQARADADRAAWKRAHAEIARKIWMAKPSGRDAVCAAIASARDAYRDIPRLQGRDVVSTAVDFALNNPPPAC
jgi:hypothetical protein